MMRVRHLLGDLEVHGLVIDEVEKVEAGYQIRDSCRSLVIDVDMMCGMSIHNTRGVYPLPARRANMWVTFGEADGSLKGVGFSSFHERFRNGFPVYNRFIPVEDQLDNLSRIPKIRENPVFIEKVEFSIKVMLEVMGTLPERDIALVSEEIEMESKWGRRNSLGALLTPHVFNDKQLSLFKF